MPPPCQQATDRVVSDNISPDFAQVNSVKTLFRQRHLLDISNHTIRYLYGMTRTTMTGMATILRWKDADGNYVFDVDEMVGFDTLRNN